MTARNFLVLIGSQILATIVGAFAYFMMLLLVSDVLSDYADASKLISILLLGVGFFVLSSSAASRIVQVSVLPLSIAFLIVSAVGSFILLPTTDVLSITTAASVTILSMLIVMGAIKIGKEYVDAYAENASISSNVVYFSLTVEIVIVTAIALYTILFF